MNKKEHKGNNYTDVGVNMMYRKKSTIITLILTVILVVVILNYNGLITSRYVKESKAKIATLIDNSKVAIKNSKENIMNWYNFKIGSGSNENNREIEKVSEVNAGNNKTKIIIKNDSKEEILSYASTLSVIDYKRVENYLNNSQKEDIKDSQDLLKKRLSNEDYNKICKIYEAIYKENNIVQN